MPSIQKTETTLEKLWSPVTVAGLEATLANVTRTFRVELPSLAQTQVGEPVIEVLWGVTKAGLVAELLAEKARVVAEADAQVKSLDAEKATIEAVAVAGEDVAIG
jgi:hypothetical protein